MKHLEGSQSFTNTCFNFHWVWGSSSQSHHGHGDNFSLVCLALLPLCPQIPQGTTLGSDHANSSPSHKQMSPGRG